MGEVKRYNGIVALMQGETDPEGELVTYSDYAALERVLRECRDALKDWQDHLAESLNCMDAKEQAIFFRGRIALAAVDALEESHD